MASEVFEPLQRYLGRRATHADAEDALSEVMMTAWRRLDEVPEGAALPWSYGVARRVLANQRRASRRQLRLVGRLEGDPSQHRFEPDPADEGLDPELEAALLSLKEDDRELIRLWAWERLEPREIAPVLGVSVNAATIRLSRARKRMTAALDRQDSRVAGHLGVEGTQERRDD